MNIEGVNLSSSSANNLVPGGQVPLSENGATHESFSNTLTGQVGLLKKANTETNSTEQATSTSSSKPNNKEQDTGSVLQSKSGEENSVKGLFKDLSAAYKQNTPVVDDKAADLQSKLQALTDEQQSKVVSVASEAKSTLQNIVPTLTDKLKSAAQNVMPDAMTIAQNMSAAMAINSQSTANTLPDKAAASATLKDAAKSITSDITPDTTILAQNMSAAMAINTQAATNVQPDKTLTTTLTDAQNKGVSITTSDLVVASDALQKETATNQPAQNGQTSNLPSFENLLSSEKALAVKDLLSTSDSGQIAPAVSTDIAGTQQAVITNRIDSPVLTKPLTHPDWSKDLGNQIVWMNNKELSTAEIRINPEHLGPISVRIDLTQDQASVQFTAQHTEVKEALEASIPKLREMLGTQQLNLTNITVSQGATSDQGQSQSPYQSFAKTPENQEHGIEGVATDLSEQAASSNVVVNKGLLSIYA